MTNQILLHQNYRIGKIAAWFASFLGFIYMFITFIGLLMLESPQNQISNPYFSIMEIITLMIAPVMVVSMVTVHYYASSKLKSYSLAALTFMILMAGITSSVHATFFIIGDLVSPDSLYFSFKWPSVVYVLDILAWDWFFALSMLFASPVFRVSRLEKTIRFLMIVSGILSLLGLTGIPLENMQIRNIGIIGYGVVAPVVFLLLGIAFQQKTKHG